jgi:hypothetical protein
VHLRGREIAPSLGCGQGERLAGELNVRDLTADEKAKKPHAVDRSRLFKFD